MLPFLSDSQYEAASFSLLSFFSTSELEMETFFNDVIRNTL